MPSRIAMFASCLLFALLCGATASAEDAPPAASALQRPVAIPVADILSRADADERFAANVSARAAGRDPTIELARRLDAIAQSVRAKADHSRAADLRMLPVLRLESLNRHWKFDARRYARWRADMDSASARYADDAAELVRRTAEWKTTQAAANAGGMTPALADRVSGVLAQLGSAERALSAPLDRQIRLGRRANALEAEIDAGQKAVAAAIAYIDRRLTRIDAPPLWAAAAPSGTSQGAVQSIRMGMVIEGRFLRDYSAANLDNQRLLNVLQLLLLPLLVWLGIRSRRQPVTAGPDDEAHARVLRRPLSSWLLLAMIGVLVFEPDAPLLLHQFAMLIAMVPVLRLLPPRSHRLLGLWPYAATALYLCNRLGFLLLANDYAYRWYILVLTVLGLALTLWMLWRSHRRVVAGKAVREGQAMRAAAWLGVAILVVSAAANVFGNVSLSEMLTGGLIDCGYMGLALYASVTVFTALLGLLIARAGGSGARLVREHAVRLLQLFARLLAFVAIAGWAVFAMTRFRVYRPVSSALRDALSHSFEIGEISISLGHVLLFAVSVLVAFWVAKTVRFLLREEVMPKMSLPRGVGNSIASLSYYGLLLLGLLVALAAAGFKVSQLTIVFGALGVGIGLGLQGVVNNFVSGLILMFERPIQPGDMVDITGTSGRVRDIGMRATTIRTFDGADVVVPNGTLLSEKLTNWTLLDMNRRVDVDVGVAYGSDPVQVIALLEAAAGTIPGVVKEPAPTVLFVAFGASSLNFSIRAWTREYENWQGIRSNLMTRIHAALVEAGIGIPFPQQDLHLRSVSDEAAAALAATRPDAAQ